jgi:hypothetical protein
MTVQALSPLFAKHQLTVTPYTADGDTAHTRVTWDMTLLKGALSQLHSLTQHLLKQLDFLLTPSDR